MADYPITISNRRHHAMVTKPDLYDRYEGYEANNNYQVVVYARKGVTTLASNDTITLTIS